MQIKVIHSIVLKTRMSQILTNNLVAELQIASSYALDSRYLNISIVKLDNYKFDYRMLEYLVFPTNLQQ